MPAGSISPSTDLVLADAVYLKARWATAFDPTMTAPGAFEPELGPAVQTPFMNETVVLPYATNRDYRAIELPYEHSQLALLAVMPAPGTLPRFERQLTARGLSAIAGSLRDRFLGLAMPKLHLSVQTSLNGVLASLGMPIAFTREADFTGISDRPQLALTAVEHAAVLRIDEAGTVAAAATGISVGPTAIAVPPITQVRLDHPFLLFLRDRATGTILFAARVENPSLG
jgi:serpin B